MTDAHTLTPLALQACAQHYRTHPTPVTANSRPSLRSPTISQHRYEQWRQQLPPDQKHTAPTSKTIRHTYGTWNNAMTAAGLPTNTPPRQHYSHTTKTIAQAAIQEWLTWQHQHPNWAPPHFPHGQAWRQSRREYDQWRSLAAPAAPNYTQLRKHLGPLQHATHTAHTWPTPHPNTLTHLYRDRDHQGQLLHARNTPTPVTFHITATLRNTPDHTTTELLISSHATFEDLAHATQTSFNKDHSHLYRFTTLEAPIIQPRTEHCRCVLCRDDRNPLPPDTVTIKTLLSTGTTMQFECNIGHRQKHDITVTKILNHPLPGNPPWQVTKKAHNTPT